MAEDTIIAVDLGNWNVKTRHTEPFPSGLTEFRRVPPPAMGQEQLCWNGDYYAISGNRRSVVNDKTKDDFFYVLTLFAIAREMIALNPGQVSYHQELILSIGLPPMHQQKYGEAYEKYFLRDREWVKFTYKDVDFEIRINDVDIWPQGFSALFCYMQELKDKTKLYIVDVGGYTTDVISAGRGLVPDMNLCESYEDLGMIGMYSKVESALRHRCNYNIARADLDAIMRGELNAPSEILNVIKEEANVYMHDLLARLRQDGVDMTLSYIVFVGGGSVLMQDVIPSFLSPAQYRVLTDCRANVTGYDSMSRRKHKARITEG